MTSRAFRFTIAVVAAGVAGSLSALAPAATAERSSARPAVGSAADPTKALLNSVSASAADDIWAVGERRDHGVFRTRILHSDGSTWNVVDTPPVGDETSGLGDVAAITADDAWAVGFWRSARTLTEHWDGSVWTKVASPNPGGAQLNLLNGVSAASPTDVWAVGCYSGRSAERTLVLHWDGVSWSQVSSPNPDAGGGGICLQDVTAVSTDDVWAVGTYAGGLKTLVIHWDGSSWTQVPSPNPSRTQNRLSSVSASSAVDVWAVGSWKTAQPLIEHWDGDTWSQVQTPGLSEAMFLTGVTAIADDDAWAVGYTKAGPGTVTLHWDGSSWTQVPSPSPKGRYGSSLNAVTAVSSSDVWAVGVRRLGRALEEHWDGTEWTRS